MIRHVKESDAGAIAEIYNWYVETSIISFEENAVTVEEIIRRIGRVDESNPWLVLEIDDQLVGYAYGIFWNSRPAYRHTRESSVYIHKDHTGKAYGFELMQALIDQFKAMPIHVLIAGIALPNSASIKLHEKLGFKKVAHFEEVGLKFNKKIDVAYWQLKL